MRHLLLAVLLLGCPHVEPPTEAPPDAAPLRPWRVPAGWRSEIIDFPLPFATNLAHAGYEELRLPAGIFDVYSPDYWSYAFAWRLRDPAVLDAARLSRQLTAYYRGLIHDADDSGVVATLDDITATAEGSDGASYALTVHVLDPWNQGLAVDLVGSARRTACDGDASLWVFSLSSPDLFVRQHLDDLAADAQCGQPPP